MFWLIDNRHPCYIGDLGLGPNPKLLERLKSADLLIAVGARLGENPTQGYTLFTPEHTAQTLVHIHADPSELSRVWPAALSAASGPAQAATRLSTIALHKSWSAWRGPARADYESFITPVSVIGLSG